MFNKKCDTCSELKDINDFFKNETGSNFIETCKSCFIKLNEDKKNCKQCNRCYEIKHSGEFNIERATKDGLSYFCKSCKKIIRKERTDEIKVTETIGKKECNTCKVIDYVKMFFITGFEDNVNIYSDQCISCYNEEHNGKYKQCAKCNDIKSVILFNKAKQNKDGLSGSCRDCNKKRNDLRIENNEEEQKENNLGKIQCLKCKEYLKYVYFFKKFIDEDKFEYYDTCRNCYTPLSLQCNKCNEIKDIDLFGIDSTKTTGHRTICKSCTNDRDRKRREENKKKQELF
jgi:hypothetical protein